MSQEKPWSEKEMMMRLDGRHNTALPDKPVPVVSNDALVQFLRASQLVFDHRAADLIERQQARIVELREALLLVLDQVDYTVGACRLTELVGAALPAQVIDKARAALEPQKA